MKKMTTIVLIFTASVLIAGVADARLTRDQRVADAQAMIALFEHRYAPVQWKKDYLGISLDDLTANLVSEVYKEDMTDEEFYAAMARYSGGVKDTHNWFNIPSTFKSRLGFTCDYVEDRVLISFVDRDLLPEAGFPFKRGDEIISIDGVAVADIMADLAQYDTHGTDLAQKRFLAMDLTIRAQRRFPSVPTGQAALEIYSQERGAKESITLPWQTSGTPLTDGSISADSPLLSKAIQSDSDATKRINPLETLRWSAIDEETAINAGLREIKPFFPLWNSFVERTKSPLLSGIFLLDGKRIGFIRINTWYPDDWKAFVSFFEKEIPFLERETDALVIDQTDNSGGYICLGEIVSQFLVSDPIPANLFQIRANQHFLLVIEEWYNEYKDYFPNPDKIDRQIVDNLLIEMRRAISDGDILTKPVTLCFNDGFIHPYVDKDGNKIAYTKPILMLINEWSISTADMTPAPLQDSGRAVMFGARTCGAGGNVETIERLGYSDFGISQTESLTVRPKEVTSPNGIPTRYLENVGVAPDVEYPITIDDFMGGYSGYRNAIDDTLLMMVK